ncbi:MAG: ATP-binding protein [Pseudomonadota bacterium]
MTPLFRSRGESATDWDMLEQARGASSALQRLWRGFMAARSFIAIVLLVLQLFAITRDHPAPWAALALSITYLAGTLLTMQLTPFTPPIRGLGGAWLVTIGVDLAAFTALQLLEAGSINYAPLFALPVLMGSVLGTVTVGLGTSAAVTLLLLADAGWHWLRMPADASPRFVQAALTGTGLFVVALLAHELARRLAREEAQALRSRGTAQMHAQVNSLVIETLAEGILVIDSHGRVHAANPAAAEILGQEIARLEVPFALTTHTTWHALAALADRTFERQAGQVQELTVAQAQDAVREVRVRTQLTPTHDRRGDSLCVMFVQDLRELEARIRTEKLAAMGRMSAAVAHEIRNPLAAITQASALLNEDLSDPAHRRLATMVEHNARRLARIVDDVLDVARVGKQRWLASGEQLPLDSTVEALAQEWVRHTHRAGVVMQLEAPGRDVGFDAEHLRRILVNLLDNASRHASNRDGAIRLGTRLDADGRVGLQVWSDGAPLEPAVQRHLFEPFFSSESRSSGLGLFLCRELCERHGATIGYQRRSLPGKDIEGNEFFVAFAPADTRLTQ